MSTRRALVGGAVVLFALGAATVRVVASGEAELRASTEALRAGDAREATVRARRAAGWYAPGAPHVGAAYARLEAIARAAEEHRHHDIALLAWRGIRTASLETRWLVTPHADALARANREIARLEGLAAGDASGALERRHLELLSAHEPPRLPWVIALLAGFAAAVAGLFLAARRAAAAAGRVDWRRARPFLLVSLAGAALWLLAVWRA